MSDIVEMLNDGVEKTETTEPEVPPVDEEQTTGGPSEPEQKPEGEEEQEESAETEPEQGEETPPEKDDRTVPIHALHEARQENHELRNRIVEFEKAKQEAIADVTPEADEDPYVSLLEDDPDAVPNITEQLAHEAWVGRQNAQAAHKQVMDSSAAAEELIKAEYTADKMGTNLDYETVTRVGVNYLTPADRLQITSNPDRVAAGKMLYDLCVKRCPVLNVLVDTTPAKPAISKTNKKKTGQVNTVKEMPTIDEVVSGPQSAIDLLSD